jgi:transcriptional regulator with XRE-family HTH domain
MEQLASGKSVRPFAVNAAIRSCRLALGLSPKELADEIGESTYFVLDLEQGAIELNEDLLARCARGLGISVDDLLAIAHDDFVPMALLVSNERKITHLLEK